MAQRSQDGAGLGPGGSGGDSTSNHWTGTRMQAMAGQRGSTVTTLRRGAGTHTRVAVGRPGGPVAVKADPFVDRDPLPPTKEPRRGNPPVS